jgi:hypothetical protein
VKTDTSRLALGSVSIRLPTKTHVLSRTCGLSIQLTRFLVTDQFHSQSDIGWYGSGRSSSFSSFLFVLFVRRQCQRGTAVWRISEVLKLSMVHDAARPLFCAITAGTIFHDLIPMAVYLLWRDEQAMRKASLPPRFGEL